MRNQLLYRPPKIEKNRTRAILDDSVFFDIPNAPVLNLEDHYITKKIETESNGTIEDDAPEKGKQRSYTSEIKKEFDENKWDYDKILEALQNDKETAKNYIMKIQEKYIILKVMPTDHIEVNYTDKPLLPGDPKKIRKTNNNTINKNKRIPDNIDTIKAMIKESQPGKE
ncbi:26090_t:CDS:2, partial [Gigaspora margarita]